MKAYRGDNQVPRGFYFDPRKLEFHAVGDEARLPGDPAAVYYRVPALAMLVFGPLMGLAYVIFLPLVGFVMLGGTLVRFSATLIERTGQALVRLARPAWQPSMAFLSRGKPARKQEQPSDAWAEATRHKLEEPGQELADEAKAHDEHA